MRGYAYIDEYGILYIAQNQISALKNSKDKTYKPVDIEYINRFPVIMLRKQKCKVVMYSSNEAYAYGDNKTGMAIRIDKYKKLVDLYNELNGVTEINDITVTEEKVPFEEIIQEEVVLKETESHLE